LRAATVEEIQSDVAQGLPQRTLDKTSRGREIMDKNFLKTITFAAVAAGMTIGMAGCGPAIAGTYTNPTGLVTLDLRSGGKASLAMMGENEDCTYEVAETKLSLTCKGEKTAWGIHDDGSLTGPGFVGTLQKSKK
jgi:hypothetical protein